MLRFSWWLTRSAAAAAGAAFVLLCSPGFFGDHAAMSGDYEALLCLLTTSYLFLLFLVLHRSRPSRSLVLLAGLLVALACLTKGVAGLIPGVGVLLYALARRRWPRLLRGPWYALSALLAVALVAGYYAAHELLTPGYLSAVMFEELAGRYLHGMRGHVQPPLYYLEMLAGLFALGPAFALPLAATFLPWKRTKAAAFLTYANFVIVTFLVVYSLGRTKIFWYLVPLYPTLSIAFVLAARRLAQLVGERAPRLTRTGSRPVSLFGALVLALGALMIFKALEYRFVQLPPYENNAPSRYGEAFQALAGQGVSRVSTIDGGVYNDDGLVDYTPQLRFYTLAWRERGLDIRAEDPDDPPVAPPDGALLTCDPDLTTKVLALGRTVASAAGCAAVAARPSAAP